MAGYLLSTRRAETFTGNAARWAQVAGAVYAPLALPLILWAMAGRPLVSL